MKRCLACVMIALIVLTVPVLSASAAGFSLPEGTQLSAQSVYIVNLDTGLCVYEQNADEKRSVASLTKLMTALLLMENVEDLEGTYISGGTALYTEEITDPQASNADILPNEEVRAIDLLYAMMLPSANEAAKNVGYFLGNGDMNNFYALMNARAAELGCTNTNFTSANGLADMDEGNYSTAHDIFLIAQECWKHEIFRTVVGTSIYWMPLTNKHTTPEFPEQNANAAYFITNSNAMLKESSEGMYRSYIKGIKTGSTYDAGRNFVSAAVNDVGESFIGVVLGCPWEPAEDGYALSFHDTATLYDWIFSSFSVRPTLSTQTPIHEVKVTHSSETDTLALVPADDLATILPNDSDDALQQTFDVPESVEAPIKKGDKIGTVTVSLSGEVIGTVDLLAAEDVDLNPVLYFFSRLKAFFTSTYMCVVYVLTTLFFLFYAGLYAWLLHDEKKRRARRRPPSSQNSRPQARPGSRPPPTLS